MYLGLRISRGKGGGITMCQRALVRGMEQIPVARERGEGRAAPHTSEETTSLRRVLGALHLSASPTRPDISAEASMLRGAFQRPADGDLLNVNELIRRAKATDHVVIRLRSSVGAPGSMLMVFSHAALQNAPLGGGGSDKVCSLGGHLLVEVEGAQLSDAPRFDVLA